jgi:hypothetical protein
VKPGFKVWVFKFSLYRYILDQLRANRGVSLAAMMAKDPVGPLYKLNPVVTHSLQAPGDQTLEPIK